MICKVCNRYFRAKKENKYTVTETPVGINVLIMDTKYYEAFDCPKCGCQNIVNERKLEFIIPMEGEKKDS